MLLPDEPIIMGNKPVKELKQLPLWSRLEKAATHEQVAGIEKLVELAAGRLLQIRDTFPTYTLHDREHADNVVRLMGELLDDNGIKNLSALEAAILILGAYFHDAGMAFTAEECAGLRHEEHFSKFLGAHPEASVTLERAKGEGLPDDIAERYCRWRHGERVFDVLNGIREDHSTLLLWETHDIGEMLAHLCQSHNLEISALNDDEQFPIDFRYECDLRFCAILLRLADILDFDRSRSPEQVYRDLGLAKRRDHSGSTSDLEWRKHLASEGFVFPGKREPDYQLGFLAGSNEPAVEYDIRGFLTVIEAEFTRCAAVLRSCSGRWQSHLLPGRIDQQNIRSKGYTYGEHRFTLDRHEVLQLLMGDKLYEDPYVFVRELLQNALDTSRHREFYEQSMGNPDFRCEPIQVSEWIDSEGYQWVRIEDFGMGMSEEIINDFLLKVGRSYYNSARFEADVIRYARKTKAGHQFKPISRFGIGLLSCFIVGDRVEIATRHVSGDDGPIRLSLSGVQRFFTLQKRPNLLTKMPGPPGKESGERKLPGTTLCIRLDPRKSDIFVLATELQRHLLAPPVPVIFEGRNIGGDPKELLDTPWCEPTTIILSEADTKKIGDVFGATLTEPIELRLLPVDITNHSPSPYIKGQLFTVFLEESEELRLALESSSPVRTNEKQIAAFIAMNSDNAVTVKIQAYRKGVGFEKDKKTTCSINFMPYLTVSGKSWDELAAYVHSVKLNKIACVGHNGISLPLPKSRHQDAWLSTRALVTPISGKNLESTRWYKTWGLVIFLDNLRPDVSISRDELVSLPWAVRSACELAVWRALTKVMPQERIEEPGIFDLNDEEGKARQPPILLGELLSDELLTREEMWPWEKIFSNGKNRFSVMDLKSDPSRTVTVHSPFWSKTAEDFSGVLQAFLTRYWLRMVVWYEYNAWLPRQYSTVVASGERSLSINEAEKLFPPLFFAEYKGKHNGILRVGGNTPHRLDHPFSQWLLKYAVSLHQNYPGLFGQIRDALLASQSTDSLNSLSIEDVVQRINQSLERIGELDPKMKPPEQAFLKLADFEK
uniref:Histidine kinase-, DNA gyrase B-, and HSP90-like ATPase n=1 Tax=Candidatus Kentrum sp. SD TaxID=2126332 RepID=A0A450YB29_9GAMM|nr:MAG: Histidine kinase-, DNA gyrase B-, and HSP90-like ATPase [Candidatus Kentron sp. SD]VFK43410.1 MAG: Histidine kinase-, DNA gyrase B-, and HSP90-like ATPase [Candidatus Kentron sp. SD]